MTEENIQFNNGKIKNKKNNNKKGLKIFLKVLLVLLIIFAIFFSILAFYIHGKLSKINYVKLENIEMNEGVSEQLKGYRNIAIFGVDARADVYDGTRSDGIMIASIDQDSKIVKLVSVYRDTMVYIDGHGYDKITHAYAYGGPELAINTINKNLDLNISEFVAVNFDAVIKIVDSIGGVEIDVTQAEVGEINKNIDSLASQTGVTTSKITHAGVQNLNGTQALAYARIRKLAGGDYKRTERMRDVLTACFNKSKKLSVGQLNKLSDIVLPNVYTNITSSEILSQIPNAIAYNLDDKGGWPYNFSGITLDRWYCAPVTLESNVIELHKNLFGNEDYQVSDKLKELSDGIIKKTGYR
jgi:LCP family protein required for cell wall assembly